ncbi:MAG: hypothetical protein K8R67_06560 [Desulfobacteraceae bacterium]|nr:hypothetical protein [Desulfobacteraceae bacterium]
MTKIFYSPSSLPLEAFAQPVKNCQMNKYRGARCWELPSRIDIHEAVLY